MSRSVETPWNPATTGTRPASRASRIRSGRISRILARVWPVSVMIPAWDPVKEAESTPRSASAMHTRAMEIRSPAVSSMSSSRGGGLEVTSSARRRRSSVDLPMAETTTTTSLPAARVRATWSATARMRSASPTEVPPYFCTTSAMATKLPDPEAAFESPTTVAPMATTKRERQKAARREKVERMQREAQASPHDAPLGDRGGGRDRGHRLGGPALLGKGTPTTTTSTVLTTADRRPTRRRSRRGCPAKTTTAAQPRPWASAPAMTIGTTKTYDAHVTTTAGPSSSSSTRRRRRTR